jgi:hypothetical protein
MKKLLVIAIVVLSLNANLVNADLPDGSYCEHPSDCGMDICAGVDGCTSYSCVNNKCEHKTTGSQADFWQNFRNNKPVAWEKISD